jgi:hypothetical protein
MENNIFITDPSKAIALFMSIGAFIMLLLMIVAVVDKKPKRTKEFQKKIFDSLKSNIKITNSIPNNIGKTNQKSEMIVKTMKFRDLNEGQQFMFPEEQAIGRIRYVCQKGKTEMYCPYIGQNTIGHEMASGDEVYLKSDREVILIYPVRQFHLRADKERVESGPVQFGNDWKGLFLRGDDCIALKFELEKITKDAGVLEFTQAKYVLNIINEVLSPQTDAELKKQVRFNARKRQLSDLGFRYDKYREYNFILPGIWSCFWEQVYNPTDEEWADYLNAVKEAIERHNNKLNK